MLADTHFKRDCGGPGQKLSGSLLDIAQGEDHLDGLTRLDSRVVEETGSDRSCVELVVGVAIVLKSDDVADDWKLVGRILLEGGGYVLALELSLNDNYNRLVHMLDGKT